MYFFTIFCFDFLHILNTVARLVNFYFNKRGKR